MPGWSSLDELEDLWPTEVCAEMVANMVSLVVAAGDTVGGG